MLTVEKNRNRPQKSAAVLLVLAALMLGVPWGIVLVRYQGWRFVLYLLFWTLLPGCMVVERIIKLSFPVDIRLLVGFFTGGGMLIAEFFVLYALGALWLLRWVNPVLTVILLLAGGRPACLRLSAWRAAGSKALQNWPFLLLLVAIVWMSLLKMNAAMPCPESDMHVDVYWNISSINQFASDMPFNDIRVDGSILRYHYFGALFLGLCKRIFGGLGYLYLVQYEILYVPLLLCLALYRLMRSATSDRMAAALGALFCVAGSAWSLQYQTLCVHLTSNVNATAMGIALLITLYFVTYPIIQRTGKPEKICAHILLASFLMMLLTGWKGPYPPVFLAGMAAYIMVSTWHDRRLDKPTVILFLCLSVAFLFVYRTLFPPHVANMGGLKDMLYGILYSVRWGNSLANRVYKVVQQHIGGYFWDEMLGRLAAFPISYFGTVTLYGIPMALCLADGIRYLLHKKQLEPWVVFSSLVAFAGGTAFYTFSLYSTNQLYFLFAALPFIGMVSLNKWEQIKNPRWKKCIAAAAAVLLILHGEWNNIVDDYSASPIMACNYLAGEEPVIDTTVREEYEGFDFLRKQTPPDSLLASNWVGKDTRDSRLSAFSERRCYLNGYTYDINYGFSEEAAEQRKKEMSLLFGDGWSDAEKYAFAQEHHIDYIVVFEREEQKTAPSDSSLFKPVFTNPSVSIFAVE